MNPNQSPDFPPIMAGIAVVAAVCCASAIWPVVETVVGVGLAVLTAVVLTALAVGLRMRRWREYREDQADLAYAATIRATRAAARGPARATHGPSTSGDPR